MTRMLACVTGPQEAAVALAGNADMVTLQEPGRGTGGAVDPDTVRRSVAAVGGRRPFGAVASGPAMLPEPLTAAVAGLVDLGVDFVQLGIAPGAQGEACIRALAPLAHRVQLMGVLVGDTPPALDLLPLMADHGFSGAMVDTAGTGGRRLLDHLDLPLLHGFVDGCRRHDLLSGLAGSLEAPDIPRLLVLQPGFLGFRAALCGEAAGADTLESRSVRAIRDLIPAEDPAAATSWPGDRLPRHSEPVIQPEACEPTDCVFVHQLVLPVRIGAYAHERAAPQLVRFDIDVAVARATHPVREMRDVFSYDVIRDGIRMLVDAGHVALVETLAERIADMLLSHARVVKVAVRLEKLDTACGTVGVAIERTGRSRPRSCGWPR